MNKIGSQLLEENMCEGLTIEKLSKKHGMSQTKTGTLLADARKNFIDQHRDLLRTLIRKG